MNNRPGNIAARDSAAQHSVAPSCRPASDADAGRPPIPWNRDARLCIHIAGGPGSGKTTLSRQLGSDLCIDPVELDVIAGDGMPPEFVPSNPMPDRITFVRQTSAGDRWITEGAFLWWTQPLMDAADLIIWLDIDRWTATRRLVRRYLSERLAELRKRRRPAEIVGWFRHPYLRSTLAFGKWTWRYYDPLTPVVSPLGANLEELSRTATTCALAAYEDKVIRITRPAPAADICRLVIRELEGRYATYH